MATYKHLLGTPLERHLHHNRHDRNNNNHNNNNNNNINAYQFTPIGQQGSDIDFSVLNSNGRSPRNNRNNNSYILNTVSKSKQNANGDKTLSPSDTFDTFSTSTPLISFKENRDTSHINNNNNNDSGYGAGSRFNDFLKHSSNPLKQQQENIDHLKAENYGLKIKIASLTKYLDVNTPEDIKKLINENGDLKLEIGHLNIKTQKLNQTIEQQKNSTTLQASSSSNVTVNKLTAQIETLINEKDQLLLKVDKLQKSLDAQPSPAASNKSFTHLQNEIEDLQYELRNKTHELEEQNLQLEQLRNKCQRLEDSKEHDLAENDQLEETIIDKNEEIKKLYQQLDDKGESVEKLADDLYKLKLTINEKDSEINSLNNKLSKKEAEASNLKVKLKSLENNGSSSNKKVEKLLKELDEKSSKVKSLNSQIHEYESQLTLSNDEIESLHSHIESLRNQLASSSRNSHYDLENEITRLREMDQKLRSELSRYKLRVTELEVDLEEQKQFADVHNTTFLNSVAQIENERDQAYDDLKIYEDHIMDLENKLNNALFDIESLQAQQRQANNDIINLKSENESLHRQTRYTSTQSQPKKKQTTSNSGGGGFFSNFWNGPTDVDTDEDNEPIRRNHADISTIKRLTKEKEDLKDEIKSFELKIKHLNEDLENERSSKSLNSYEKEEIKRLAKQKNDLEVLIANKNATFESQINDYKERITSLNEEIVSKDNKINELTSSNKDTNGNHRNNNIGEVISKEDHLKLLKENIDKEKEVLILNNEKSALNQELESLKANYKKPDDKLQQQLTDKQREIDDLNLKLRTIEDSKNDLYEAMKSKQTELTNNLNSMETELHKVKENYKKIYKRYKHKNGDLSMIKEETDNKEPELAERLAAKEKELRILSDEYDTMRKDMTSRLKELQVSRKSLNAKVIDLQSKIKSSDSSEGIKLAKTYKAKLEALESKIQYYREKFHQEIYSSQDLKFLNQYFITSIKNSDKLVMSDINMLAKVGIYPDYKLLSKKKLTFKAVAKGILAAIRIKNRFLKSKQKTKTIQDLQSRFQALPLLHC